MQSGGSEHSKEFADLEDQIKKLEKEKEELKMQYEEELEAEKVITWSPLFPCAPLT